MDGVFKVVQALGARLAIETTGQNHGTAAP
jgi:hypothetical protein